MKNPNTAYVVKLDIAANRWYTTTVDFQSISQTSGCLLIWDEDAQDLIEYRPADMGTLNHCNVSARMLNSQMSRANH